MTTSTQQRSAKTGQTFVADVTVSLKPLVNDPQGLAIRDGLHSLGYDEVESVRAGKHLRLTLQADSADSARERVERMCDQLLANPVIEVYHIEISALAERAAGKE